MIEIAWPGVVLVILLGVLMGAGMAFFRARSFKELGQFLLLGVLGVGLGQVVSAFMPIHLFQIGVVDIEYGIGTAALLLYIQEQWNSRRGRGRASRSLS